MFFLVFFLLSQPDEIEIALRLRSIVHSNGINYELMIAESDLFKNYGKDIQKIIAKHPRNYHVDGVIGLIKQTTKIIV